MIKLGLIDEAGVASVREQAQQAMKLAVGALVEPDPEAKPGVRRIRPELWPDPAFVDVGIRGDLSELAECAHGRAAGLHRPAQAGQAHRRRGPGHGPADG